MRSVNKVIIVGHLAADPEQPEETKSGRTRVSFPVATHRDVTSDGTKKEVTDYHRVVAWGTLGEICAKYLSKGQGVYIEGMVLNRAYEKNGMRTWDTHARMDAKSSGLRRCVPDRLDDAKLSSRRRMRPIPPFASSARAHRVAGAKRQPCGHSLSDCGLREMQHEPSVRNMPLECADEIRDPWSVQDRAAPRTKPSH